ncbi:hypothetical protein [Blastococcus montanus]|uniref:AMIN-like domain-containing (lipo)protein n=1 Tax=Blastococcus montanus TaxID=3144973 RepID=UPI003209A55F
MMERLRRRTLAVLSGAVLAFGGLLSPAAASPTAHGDQPFCGQVWASLPEAQRTAARDLVVTDVRAGRHACFDRIVVDLRGPADRAPSYDVRYVDAVGELGSGHAVPLRGGAALRVLVGAPSYADAGRPTFLPADRTEAVQVAGFDTVEQVAWLGSFEGQTGLGVGTRARLPFRVFELLGEPGSEQAVRLVIDIGHRW